jgi:hypothetical protein
VEFRFGGGWAVLRCRMRVGWVVVDCKIGRGWVVAECGLHQEKSLGTYVS